MGANMRKNVAALMFVTLFTALFSLQTSAKNILDENLDKNTIIRLAEQGQLLNLVYDKHGELTNRMCAVIADAPLDIVWNVITDYADYYKFVPEMESSIIKSSKSNEATVDFTLKIKIIMGVSSTQKYSTRYVKEKPILHMYDPENPKAEPGFWKLVPINGGKRTLILYYDKAPDLMKMGSLVSGVVSSRPELAIALQLSPISMLLDATREYSEKKAKEKKTAK